MADTPLYDQMSALLTYANGITGAGDTHLGDAVRSLADGYGGGGGGTATSWLPNGSEVVFSQTDTYNLSADTSFDSITLSNTSQTVLAAGAAGSLCQYTADFSNYDYVIVRKGYTHIARLNDDNVYPIAVSFACTYFDFFNNMNWSSVFEEYDKQSTERNFFAPNGTWLRMSNATYYLTGNSSIGIRPQFAQSTISGNVIKLATPSIMAGAHGTYFPINTWSNIDSASTNITVETKIYRLPKGTSIYAETLKNYPNV